MDPSMMLVVGTPENDETQALTVQVLHQSDGEVRIFVDRHHDTSNTPAVVEITLSREDLSVLRRLIGSDR